MTKSEQKLNILSSALLALVVLVSSFVVYEYLLPSGNKGVGTTAIAPDDEEPPEPINQGQPQLEELSRELLDGPYRPTNEVYGANYESESLKLALEGEFETLRLAASGTIEDKKIHFVSIAIGEESGTLNSVRSSSEGININASRDLGGVFEVDDGIRFTVNLLGETILATTGPEFEETNQPTKIVTFWDAITPQPPTVTRVVVAPFNENGKFEGVRVDSITVLYSCKENGACKVDLCPVEELESDCIGRAFGPVAEAKYKAAVGLK